MLHVPMQSSAIRAFDSIVRPISIEEPSAKYCFFKQATSRQYSNNDVAPIHIKLQMLKTMELVSPLDVIIEKDEEGYIARNPELPLYGYGTDVIAALEALKADIESLYNDLMEDDNFSESWLRYKIFLKERVATAR